jgi:type VI protein secretion system component VasK
MTSKLAWGIIITVLSSVILAWATFVTCAPIANKDAILFNKQEIALNRMEFRTELKSIAKTLTEQNGLLKEIREDQKQRYK